MTKVLMDCQRTVVTILARYQHRNGCRVPITYGDVYGDVVSQLSGDEVTRDNIEIALVHLKRRGAITRRKMVTLLARHLREASDRRAHPCS